MAWLSSGDVSSAIGQDYLACCVVFSLVLLPPAHDVGNRVGVLGMGMHTTVFGVALNGGRNLAFGQFDGGVLLPGFALPADLLQCRGAHQLLKGPKWAASFDGLQLLGIAHKDNLGTCLLGDTQQIRHLAGANHACLVHDEHIALAKSGLAVFPSIFPRGQGPAIGDFRTAPQALGSLA